MADARQLADKRVGDVLGDVPCGSIERGPELGLPATQKQDGEFRGHGATADR